MALLGLPIELLCMIVWGFIRPCDRAPLRSVCRQLRMIVNDPHHGGACVSLKSFRYPHATPELYPWYFHRGPQTEQYTNTIMRHAAKEGDEALVRLCHDQWKATDVNGAIHLAAEGGHIDIVRLCYVQGATDVNGAMADAALGGHIDIVRLCHDVWGATGVDWAMAWAAEGGHINIVHLCQGWLDDA